MAYRALTDVMLGNQPPALAGDLIPDTYVDMTGAEQSVDFARLVELGAAEEIKAAPQKPKQHGKD